MAKRDNSTFNGQPAKKMFDIMVESISLVPSGASREEFVAKDVDGNITPPWFKAWSEKSNARLEALEERYGLSKSGDAFRDAQVGDYVRDDSWVWLEKKDSKTFVEVHANLAGRLEKANALRRSGKKLVRRIAEVSKPKNKRNARNNRASVDVAKTDLEKHLDYYSALHSIASNNGEYTAQQRADMVDLAHAASQHGGPDRVWGDMLNSGPDAFAARNRTNPLRGRTS